MPDYQLQREVRTPHSESYFIVEGGEHDVGRLDVHYPVGMVHATIVVKDEVSESDMREIISRFFNDMNQLVGVDGVEIAVHTYKGEDKGVFHNDDLENRRNGNGHAN